MAMSRKKKEKERAKKKRSDRESAGESKGLFDSMKPETIRGIGGVFLFVLAVLLVLSPLRLAGVVGDYMYEAIYKLVGFGYFLVPVMLVFWAVSLFNKRYSENALRPVRTAGALLFFMATLAMVGALSAEHAGILGRLMADPLITYFGLLASMVILAGSMLIALLLLLDSELWILLFKKLKALFVKEKEVGDEQPMLRREDDVPDYTYAEEAELQARGEEKAPEPVVEEDDGINDVSDLHEEEDFKELFGKEKAGAKEKEKKKKKAPFVMPSEYVAPSLDLLETDRGESVVGDTKARSNIIKKTFQHFKISVEMGDIIPGPTVTQYTLKPAAGVRISKIKSLQSNLELALAAAPIRIQAPIPGKALVGIEVPNKAKSTVGIADLLGSPEFLQADAPLYVTLGRGIAGSAEYANLAKMPHLLVAGTTGSGKSVLIHTLITSLLYRNAPERLRLILVDPKRVELTLYKDIPHLLTPVITNAKKCILALKWAAKEMERRLDILQEHGVQNISSYHEGVVAPAFSEYSTMKDKGADLSDIEVPDPMPHIVIVIDELADIMSAHPRELEAGIVRLAQLSRAVGIHLILSTQRPSVNVITGLIKANIPARIALKVASGIDSRTILDTGGAETLVGQGDMLYLSGAEPEPRRIQSPFLTEKEVKRIVAFLKENNGYSLDAPIDFANGDSEHTQAGGGIPFDTMEEDEDRDPLYEDIRDFAVKEGRISTSLIQRRFKIGYGRAARIIDSLERAGVVSASDGTNKPRTVIGAGGGDVDDDAGYEYDDDAERSEEDERYGR